MPYWTIILALPFCCKSFITMPIHIYQQRKYESRLKTLPIAVYEINKLTHKERLSRKRGTANNEEHLMQRKQVFGKYGYNVSKTQLLPYTAAAVQIPIHLTMFVSLRTMSSEYPLWSSGGPQFLNNLSNLSVIDSSMALPLSIGCTMAVLQYMMYQRNKVRSAGLNSHGLMLVNVSSIAAIAYLSISWSVGFNLYILSNLSSYVVQQKLMDSNIFRRMVGLNKYSDIQPDIKKLQIVYHCMKLSIDQDRNSRMQHMETYKDHKSSFNAIPQMEYTWIRLLQNPKNFASLNVTDDELNAVLKDISEVDNIEGLEVNGDEEMDDEDEALDTKQYSMQFTDREEIENRRRQIRKATSKHTMRSFLMEKDMKQKTDYDDDDEEGDADENLYKEYEEVSVQEIETGNDSSQKKKKKIKKSK